jgi:hypothetical protein
MDIWKKWKTMKKTLAKPQRAQRINKTERFLGGLGALARANLNIRSYRERTLAKPQRAQRKDKREWFLGEHGGLARVNSNKSRKSNLG